MTLVRRGTRVRCPATSAVRTHIILRAGDAVVTRSAVLGCLGRTLPGVRIAGARAVTLIRWARDADAQIGADTIFTSAARA